MKKLFLLILTIAVAAAIVWSLMSAGNSREEPSRAGIVLVNPDNEWDGDVPELASVYDYKTGSYYVRDKNVSVAKEIVEPLNAMMDAFYDKTGLKTVNVVSGYRTKEEQQRLFDAEVEEKGLDEAKKWVAEAGFSEHHTGLAVDLALYYSNDGSSEKFDGKGDYRWFTENSWRYGFILRYPEGKAHITGIAPEPWHFRWVGETAAEEIHKNGLTLEEYLAD